MNNPRTPPGRISGLWPQVGKWTIVVCALATSASLAGATSTGVGIRTPAIQFTGTGSPLTAGPVGGAEVAVRTPAISFTGTGVALTVPPVTAANGVPVNVNVRTAEITFAGTGAMD